MMIINCAAVILIALASPATAPDGPPEAEPLKPLFFRFDAETDKVHSLPVRVDASTEDGKLYDRVTADADGDGKYETPIKIETDRSSSPGRMELSFPLELAGQEWRIDLMGSLADPLSRPFYFHWTGRTDEFYTWFINGKVKPHATAADAAEAKAVRLGPPFEYRVRSTTRGPNALIAVGLTDGNGATMRLAGGTRGGSRDGTESNISLTLSQGGEKRSTLSAEYG